MLTQERLKELLHYNPETGILVWISNSGSRGNYNAGAVAGGKHKCGYLHTHIDRKAYLIHRLAWLYVYGHFPPHHIDHINGVRCDNRISNLRLATESENAQNRRLPQKNNKIGMIGVSKHRGRYRASISMNKKWHFLGSFDTSEEASKAYLKAKRLLHLRCTI